MAEKRNSSKPGPDTRSTGKKSTAKKTTKRPKPQAAEPESQLSTLVAKSIDLAEAGLSLGLNLVQKLGGSLQHDLADKFARAKDAFVNTSTATADRQSPEPAETAGPAEEPAHAAYFAGVVNRLPLFPGSPVHVSFSINNDAPDQPKKVSLRLSALTGELTGKALPPSTCTVKPGTSVIAPLDFDKFVITGTIPIDTKGDAYCGFIEARGQEELQIPLRLIVTASE
jgi:hypothetical protein